MWSIFNNKQDFLESCDNFDSSLRTGWEMCIQHIEDQALWHNFQLAETNDVLKVPCIVTTDDHFMGLANAYGLIQFVVFHRDGLLWSCGDLESCFYLFEMLEGR